MSHWYVPCPVSSLGRQEGGWDGDLAHKLHLLHCSFPHPCLVFQTGEHCGRWHCAHIGLSCVVSFPEGHDEYFFCRVKSNRKHKYLAACEGGVTFSLLKVMVQVSTDLFLTSFYKLLFTSTYFLGILLWLLKNVTPLFLGGRWDIGIWQMSKISIV